jgi:hypothetical protein
MAEERLLRPCVELAYARPRRNGGGIYVTPKFGCTQKGHFAGSETRDSDSGAESEGAGVGAGSDGWCSGGWGSGLLICTKHSEHIA